MSEKKKVNIVVNQFPHRESTEAILELMRNGEYIKSKGLPERKPFDSFVKATNQELSEYTKPDGTPHLPNQKRYQKKKRGIVFTQLHSLVNLGIADIKNKTTDSSYGLTQFGHMMTRGYYIMREAHRQGLSFEDVWGRVFQDASPPEVGE